MLLARGALSGDCYGDDKVVQPAAILGYCCAADRVAQPAVCSSSNNLHQLYNTTGSLV